MPAMVVAAITASTRRTAAWPAGVAEAIHQVLTTANPVALRTNGRQAHRQQAADHRQKS